MTEQTNVLRFWRDVEVFNIPAPPTEKDNTADLVVNNLKYGAPLPWERSEYKETPTHIWTHGVYIGVQPIEDLLQAVLTQLSPGDTLSEKEINRQLDQGWLAAFTVNSAGIPIPDQYTIASFVLGVERFHQDVPLDGLNADIWGSRKAFDQRMGERAACGLDSAPSPTETPSSPESATPPPLNWGDLEQETRYLLDKLRAGTDPKSCEVVIKSLRSIKDSEDDQEALDLEYLNSFFLDDLDRLVAQSEKGTSFGDGLKAYLGAPLATSERIDVLADPTRISTLVSPARLPAGRWPVSADTPLYLAQQSAVYTSLHLLKGDASGVLGINGPPGTGKTTLLCDIIADIVVERAKKLSQLDDSKELFLEKPIDIGGQRIWVIQPDIVRQTSIVVASTNNSAVKNISEDLPKSKKLGKAYSTSEYLQAVAKSVAEHQPKEKGQTSAIAVWGVISAVLGSKRNRNIFLDGFWPKPDTQKKQNQSSKSKVVPGSDGAMPAAKGSEQTAHSSGAPEQTKKVTDELDTLEKLLNHYATPDEGRKARDRWHEVKERFLDLLGEFEERQEELIHIESLLKDYAPLGHKIATMAAHINDSRMELNRARISEESGQVDYARLQKDLESAERSLMAWHQMPKPLLDRICYWFSYTTPRMQQWLDGILDAQKKISQLKESELALRQRLGALKAKSQQIESEVGKCQREKARLDDLLAQYDAELAEAQHSCILPSKEFFKQSPDHFHVQSLWVHQELDDLRARIFIQALRLHEATIYARAKAILNAITYVRMLIRSPNWVPFTAAEREVLWNHFFFIVPVVSTSLASFSRLFDGMPQESLGWLLLDEAGQATPQAAAGALWRSKRSILVGDPLQIEPVVTLPERVVQQLLKKYKLSNRWSPFESSAQVLADHVTPYGAFIKNGERGIWSGMPLRAHRRCESPMFEIANRIAYEEQMVQAKKTETIFVPAISKSQWYHVRGTPGTNNGQVVPEEIEALDSLLSDLIAKQPYIGLTPAQTAAGEMPSPATIYVLSPFKKVVKAAQALIDTAHKSSGVSIQVGTVHTFQGKEADVVIVVLGSAPGDAGSSSRNWVCETPNILNVAVTRARARLYIIGNLDDWEETPLVQVLQRELRLH